MSTATAQRLEPEWWERIGERTQRWAEAHPRAWRVLSIARVVLGWLAVAALVLALVFVAEVRMSFLESLAFLLPLVILFALTRTRTVRWRIVAAVFSGSIALAVLIALVSQWFGGSVLGGPNSDGPAIAIAAHFEEVGKLLPLALIAILAPGRARRFATADWFLLGYAAGVGFLVAEEGARGIMYSNEPGIAIIHQVLQNAITGPALFLNPFDVDVLGKGNFALLVSHPVATGAVAGAVGIGVALWRARHRVWAIALPVAVGLLVITNHALGNAGRDDLGELLGAAGLPAPMTLLWFATGRGHAMPWIAAAIFVTCLLLDVARRRRVDGAFPGFLLPSAAARSRRLAAWSARHGIPAKAAALVAAAGVQWWSDARLALSGYPRKADEPRRTAARRGRGTSDAALRARQLAMSATTPEDTVASRRRFRRTALWAAAAAVVFAVVVGTIMASIIGTGLSVPDDMDWPWSNIGGVFDYLEHWWNRQPWWQHLLLSAALVGLLWLYGLPLGLALANTGYLAYGIGHSGPARDLAKDPAGSLGHYLLHRSPAEMLADGLDFGLTFIPGFGGLKGEGGDLLGFLFGDMTVEGVGDLPGMDGTIADELGLGRPAAPAHGPQSVIPPADASTAPAGGVAPPPGDAAPPPVSARGVLEPGPGEVVASRTDLAPSTAYDVPGRGTFITDGSGRVVFVQQAPGGDIDLDLRYATPGVDYVKDGFIYQVDDAGNLSMRPAP